MQSFGSTSSKIYEVAARIRELREIAGYSQEEMAQRTEVSPEMYRLYEEGQTDFPFTFIHKCALELGVEITDLMEGKSVRLTGYTVTRKGMGEVTAKETGLEIRSLAPLFKRKIAEPYFVRYEYVPEQQSRPIHLTRHSGQEFDLILSGSLKVQVGEHIEVLHEGDSIYYDSSVPHGMIAVEKQDCEFYAFVLNPNSEPVDKLVHGGIRDFNTAPIRKTGQTRVWNDYIIPQEDAQGCLTGIQFRNTENFNFAYDVIDRLGREKPDKLAMLHIAADKTERRFTFKDLKDASSQTANYFKSLGIRKGDRVMLILKRHYQFWFAILALHKLGAIAIPASNQLKEHDMIYRLNKAGVKMVVCTADDHVPEEMDKAALHAPSLQTKILVGGEREGWRNFDEEYTLFTRHLPRPEDAACGDDLMLMYFTSGTTGNPKLAMHNFKYPLGHFITAKYWHCVNPDGLHLTIADTGWAKAAWGKLYGQWLCEAGLFIYDFDRFDANDILPMFQKYGITTFCAPPTILRMMIKQDLSRFDLSTIEHMTTAGEALNPEVFRQFEKATGLQIMEGFGQSETTVALANLAGTKARLGSMGKPVPQYGIRLLDPDGRPVPMGEVGEICFDISQGNPCGLFTGYYEDPDKTAECRHDGFYHTGDTAWQDEDGYFWYVGRVDDVIKSSGYRIGPFEIENVIMELPYVLECGVSAMPDEVRGQVVKASIVLVKGKEPTEELKKEIQDYVKKHTAPYKYPRVVVFREELPKTASGKIQRNKL